MLHRSAITHSLATVLALVCAGSALAGDAPVPAARRTTAAAAPVAPPSVALPRTAATMLQEMPAFQPGVWTYHRSVEGSTTAAAEPNTLRKCSDPISDFRRNMTRMIQQGCRLIDGIHKGNDFHTTWTCPVGDGNVSVSNLITADGPTRYQGVNETRHGDKIARTVIVATRMGDCDRAASPHR